MMEVAGHGATGHMCFWISSQCCYLWGWFIFSQLCLNFSVFWQPIYQVFRKPIFQILPCANVYSPNDLRESHSGMWAVFSLQAGCCTRVSQHAIHVTENWAHLSWIQSTIHLNFTLLGQVFFSPLNCYVAMQWSWFVGNQSARLVSPNKSLLQKYR